MATFERHVSVDWQGSVMEGKGEAKAGTGAFSLPVTFPSRIGESGGKTSPEELMAAAHAACYAMALNGTLGRKSASADRTLVTATITADKGDAGIKIVSSALTVTAYGLKGADVPLLAQIIGIVDAFDALTSQRVYRDAVPHPVAVRHLLSDVKQGRFETHLVEAFLTATAEHQTRDHSRHTSVPGGAQAYPTNPRRVWGAKGA